MAENTESSYGQKLIAEEGWTDAKKSLPTRGKTVRVWVDLKPGVDGNYLGANRFFKQMHVMKHNGEWLDYHKHVVCWKELDAEPPRVTKVEYKDYKITIKRRTHRRFSGGKYFSFIVTFRDKKGYGSEMTEPFANVEEAERETKKAIDWEIQKESV